ncbi:MAG: (Fe-S)-binding protein [Chloroflexi bacterium]|nr:MAG: (Fe-S)-binding protein [Chloroflexota bacterium]
MNQRPSPAGKDAALFVTCMVDVLYPQTGMAVVHLLEHLGVRVYFPHAQTCCGQPGYNGGYRHDAAMVARQFLDVFQDAELIVVPSGSCATMIRHEFPVLFADDPARRVLSEYTASITWEFTEYLVDGLGVRDLGLKLPAPRTFAFHDSCHGLRYLGLSQQARDLLGHMENATITELVDHDECCGFGGLFSVKMADISGAMLEKKVAQINACPADTIVVGDVSCLTHMNGGLSRQKSAKRVVHIADVLAEGLPERKRA